MVVIKKGDIELSMGKAVGHVLEDELIGVKNRMWIITPWISKEYARLLLKKKEDGVDVKLITTDENSNKDSLLYLIEKRVEPSYSNIPPCIKPLSVLMILSSIVFIKSESGLWFILMIGGFILAYLAFSTKTVYVPKIPLTIIAKQGYDDFTHSKIYILDKKAVVGSANLTKKGLWHNWESIAIIKNENIVKEIARVFETLETHPLKEFRDIGDIGNEVYSHSQQNQ